MKQRRAGMFMLFIAASAVLQGLIAQNSASFGQQIYTFKKLKSDLEVIGVMSTTLSDNEIANLTRTSLQQGVKLFVARPKDSKEIAVIYKTLTTEKKAQLIWIPKVDDGMLGVGFEFLKENTPLDKVGICVPDSKLLSEGAFCSVQKENDKLVAYINQRVAPMIGAAIPLQEDPVISYVAR